MIADSESDCTCLIIYTYALNSDILLQDSSCMKIVVVVVMDKTIKVIIIAYMCSLSHHHWWVRGWLVAWLVGGCLSEWWLVAMPTGCLNSFWGSLSF